MALIMCCRFEAAGRGLQGELAQFVRYDLHRLATYFPQVDQVCCIRSQSINGNNYDIIWHVIVCMIIMCVLIKSYNYFELKCQFNLITLSLRLVVSL